MVPNCEMINKGITVDKNIYGSEGCICMLFKKMKVRRHISSIGLSLFYLQIMRLGGWESLDMVLRYTRSVKFEESLRLYRGLEKG